MKKNALMFVINESMVFALGTTLLNLKDKNPTFPYDVVIIHDGLTEGAVRDLRNLNEKINFIKYTLDDFASEHGVNGDSVFFKNFIKRYSFLSFIKYKIFGLLEDYKSILFLDVDVLILKDISPIFQHKGVSWRNGFSLREKLSRNRVNKTFDFIDELDGKTPAPNGGMIFVEDSIPYNEMALIAKKFISENYANFTAHIDEISIALPVAMLNVNLNILDSKEFNVVPELVNDESCVVHFVGKKVWDDYNLISLFPEWLVYYDEWRKISSFTYPNLKRVGRGAYLKQINFNDTWLKCQEYIDLPDGLVFSNATKNSWYPIFIKNDRDSFYYELKKGKDENHFKICVWFKNTYFLSSNFLEGLMPKIENIKFIDYKKNEGTGLYLMTNDIHLKELNDKFKSVYNLTFSEYMNSPIAKNIR
ncbi:glycosyltransferase [Rahnella inusitata]|uniref:glycosyltransferase n=1 Tax=Rahnella inusitata TaxID=58169 RepID=UPI0039BE7044